MACDARLLRCSSNESSLTGSSSSSSSSSCEFDRAKNKGKAPLTASLCHWPVLGASDDEGPAGSSPRCAVQLPGSKTLKSISDPTLLRWQPKAFAQPLAMTELTLGSLTPCRSVQTSLSMAESIGYSTEFVVSVEQQHADHGTLSEGMTMATLLCWTTVIVLAVAAACYIVQSIVA